MSTQDPSGITPPTTTVGQPADPLLALILWARSLGHLPVLMHAIRAAQCSRSQHVGVTLRFLTFPDIARLLATWWSGDPLISELANLADDLTVNPHLIANFPGLVASKNLARQFHGLTETHQIQMLLAQHHIYRQTGPEVRMRFQALRLWLFIQAVRLEALCAAGDNHIDDMAQDLRLAAEGDFRLQVLERMRGRITDEGSICSILNRPLQGTTDPGERDKVRDLLKRFQKVALEDRKTYLRQTGVTTEFDRQLGSMATPQQSAHANYPAEAFSNFDLTGYAEDDDTTLSINPLAGRFVAKVDPDDSASRRRLTGEGVLLRGVEQLQFLPWSIFRPTSIERAALTKTILQWAAADDPTTALLGWTTRVAILTSRSMRLVEQLAIDDESANDWQVARDFSHLHRRPPRRQNAWKPSDGSMSWLVRSADRWVIDLPPLRPDLLARGDSAKSLADVWARVVPEFSAEHLFNTGCANEPALRRLSSGQLTEVLSQAVFDATSDPVLAQLAALKQKAAMGGNAAYAAFRQPNLDKALAWTGSINAHLHAIEPGLNVAGSELDVLEDALIQAIANAKLRLEAQSRLPGEWVQFHNDLTLFVVTALLAATGARPVNDPFENPKHFDWDRSRVFVSDKTADARFGRLIPIPRSLTALLNTDYCRHLDQLADALRETYHPLAPEVCRLATRQKSRYLPFFFLLRDSAELTWASVTETAISEGPVYRGVLPANATRHRLATRLREEGLDPEVIDAMLGHSEHGVLTHGPESPRIWEQDFKLAKPILNQVYQSLGIGDHLPRVRIIPHIKMPAQGWKPLPSRLFGAVARAQQRKLSDLRDGRIVRGIIRKSLDEVPAEKKTPDDWRRLSITLSTIDGKRAHPLAERRLSFLDRWQKMFQNQGRLNLTHSLVVDRPTRDVFTADAIGAQGSVGQLCAWLNTCHTLRSLSKVGVRQAMMLGTLDLLLVCRITSLPLLTDALNARNFRLIRHEGEVYLEHHPLLDSQTDTPVARFRIAERTARCLAIGRDCKNKLNWDLQEIPPDWRITMPSNLRAGNYKFLTLIQLLAAVVTQANWIERPGLIAAYLAGQLPASSFPHRDLLLRQGRVVVAPANDPSASEIIGGLELNKSIRYRRRDLDAKRTEAAATEILSNFQRVLREADALAVRGSSFTGINRNGTKRANTQSDQKGEPAAVEIRSSSSRRDLGNELRRLLTQSEEHLSSAVWALCAWVIVLLDQPIRAKAPYRLSSIYRYLTALARRFAQVGHDFDLLSADADDVAEFYDQILTMNRGMDLHYVVARLQQFHAYLRQTHHLEDIDWQALDSGSVHATGSPGTLGLAQYLNALEVLAGTAADAERKNVAAAFLLLLSFRMGLRGNDAIGLLLQDLWVQAPMVVVHVQPNRLRKLKVSRSGRRLVPLAEILTDMEWALIENFLQSPRAWSKGNGNFALFAQSPEGDCMALQPLRAKVNTVLKSVCQNTVTSMHKARHAYANRLADLLMTDWLAEPATTSASLDAASSEHCKKLLLGKAEVTRRAPWALARALGHARPTTTFKSYIHSIPDSADSWSRAAIEAVQQQVDRYGSHAQVSIDLDKIPTDSWAPMQALPSTTPPFAAWDSYTAWLYLDLVRSGTPGQTARNVSRIPTDLAKGLDQELEVATAILQHRVKRTSTQPIQSILELISASEWLHIKSQLKQSASSPQWQLPMDANWIHLVASVISPNRQIILWEKYHFEMAKDFVQLFGLSQLILDTRKASDSTMKSWLQSADLGSLLIVDGDLGSGTAPDSITVGSPGFRVIHRAALKCTSNLKTPADRLTGHGLVLLWVVYCCLRQTPPAKT